MLMLRLISIGLSGVSTCTQADRPAAAQMIARVRPPMVSLLSSLFDKIMALARFLKAERAFPRPPWRRRPAPARAAGSADSVRSPPSGHRIPWPKRSEERREGKSVSVRVDLGGRRFIKTKKKRQRNW